MPINNLIGDVEKFLEKVIQNITITGIRFDELKDLDHLAYRVASLEEYEIVKAKMLEFGELISENIISGRPIAVYKLNEPIIYDGFTIFCLEIPAPKEGSEYKSGLEHIEFVTNKSLKEFIKDHKEVGFETKEIDREINPTLVLKFEDSAVKFHPRSLLEVCLIQQETGKL